jgi:hypothetical protein
VKERIDVRKRGWALYLLCAEVLMIVLALEAFGER